MSVSIYIQEVENGFVIEEHYTTGNAATSITKFISETISGVKGIVNDILVHNCDIGITEE